MPVQGVRDRITTEILSWEGVSAIPHRFGGTEYRLGKRELGHIHGDSLLDIPFPHWVRDELVATGQVQPHHVLPESGWVSFYLRQAEDERRAISLLRRSYEIASQQRRSRTAPPTGG
jgi:hypothetical protein